MAYIIKVVYAVDLVGFMYVFDTGKGRTNKINTFLINVYFINTFVSNM